MNLIGKNIRHLRMLKEISQEKLAADLDLSRSKISAYEEERSEPNIETLIKLSKYFHIATDALIKADLGRSNLRSLIKVADNRLLFPVLVDKDENELIEIVPVKASAGYLNGYADPQYFEGFRKMQLPFVPAGKHRAFPIKGDSMLPLCDGDYVVARFVESLKEIKNGQTYVLITKDEGIVYKRVYMDKDKSLTLHSDNKAYDPYPIKYENVLELWEYTCAINLSGRKPEELNQESIINMLRGMQVQLERIKK
jgi:transcriptional regulator with XRE-family HTH domain